MIGREEKENCRGNKGKRGYLYMNILMQLSVRYRHPAKHTCMLRVMVG